MPYLHDSVIDNPSTLPGSKTLHIVPAGTYADRAEILSASLGNKTVTVGSLENGDASGRKVRIPSITDGALTGNGTAAQWAVVSDTLYLAGNDLEVTQSVTSGNIFTLAATDIEFPDPS